jgi:hypothetical protein
MQNRRRDIKNDAYTAIYKNDVLKPLILNNDATTARHISARSQNTKISHYLENALIFDATSMRDIKKRCITPRHIKKRCNYTRHISARSHKYRSPYLEMPIFDATSMARYYRCNYTRSL